MTATPKTIQIFLPGGDPRGIRVAGIATRIVQVIEVPRSLRQDFRIRLNRSTEMDRKRVHLRFRAAINHV